MIINKTLLIANENIENKQNKILKIAKNFIFNRFGEEK